jgi:hypothetical protein
VAQVATAACDLVEGIVEASAKGLRVALEGHRDLDAADAAYLAGVADLAALLAGGDIDEAVGPLRAVAIRRHQLFDDRGYRLEGEDG